MNFEPFDEWKKRRNPPAFPLFDTSKPQFLAEAIYFLASSVQFHNEVEMWKSELNHLADEQRLLQEKEQLLFEREKLLQEREAFSRMTGSPVSIDPESLRLMAEAQAQAFGAGDEVIRRSKQVEQENDDEEDGTS